MFEPTTIIKHSTPTLGGRSRNTITLHPNLHRALRELATQEDYSVGCLVALLINEALDRRLARRGH
jgi:hypothetical protein